MKKSFIIILMVLMAGNVFAGFITVDGSGTVTLGGPGSVAIQEEKFHIGTPGAVGFGVGICPTANLPSGMVGMSDYNVPASDNHGNYQFTDGSIMVFIPKFYYRIAHADNPTYGVHGVNSIDIKGADVYTTTVAANAAGYALHRAFIDGGVEQPGFFVDKYKVSKVANGTGYTAASIKNGLPLSSASAHNPFADLTGGANYYYSAIDLAHRRDGVNGAVNASSIFHVASQFQHSALAMLSTAHGQASSSTTYCAWYHATTNFPKGCNNNALKDTNDTSVIWESDGYSNSGKTGSAGYGGGSGNVFAKSTHNGQNCGVADLNGLVYEISIGATAIASTKTISGATQGNPCVLTLNNTTGLTTDDFVMIASVVGMTQLNDKMYKITVIDGTTLSLQGINSSAYTAYSSAGTLTYGTFYTAKEATAMKSFTHGNSGATDHWGATGVAAMMDAFVPPFKAGFAFGMRFGSGTNQVLSESLSGAGWLLAGLGLPRNGDGVDASGTNLFGTDYFYQYFRNELCLLSCARWNLSSSAGVWYSNWSDARGNSGDTVGFRSACYPN